MPSLRTQGSVLRAIEEFDTLGRDAFLHRYGFAPAKRYFLVLDGKAYDTNAVFAVAYGYENPGHGPLSSNEFRGGEPHVAQRLRELGFQVESSHSVSDPAKSAVKAIVLVENEVTATGEYDDWRDVTGELYHFPNQYKNLVTSGRPFVYYRGSRRSGGRRGVPEYFGAGIIGEVVRDPEVDLASPKSHHKWFAKIEDFVPFPNPVPAKTERGYFEAIAQNRWGVGVRSLGQRTYETILAAAGIAGLRDLGPSGLLLDAPQIQDTQPTLVDRPGGLLVGRQLFSEPPADFGQGARRSPYAKAIGDRAERIVMRYLEESLHSSERRSLRWVAEAGETPGWDVEYRNRAGRLQAVEVKGTRGPKFPSFEMTANEWAAAEHLGPDYSVFLVARCLDRLPMIDPLNNPSELNKLGTIAAAPSVWRVTRGG